MTSDREKPFDVNQFGGQSDRKAKMKKFIDTQQERAHKAAEQKELDEELKAQRQQLRLLGIELDDIKYPELIESDDPIDSTDAVDARKTIKTQEGLLGMVEDHKTCEVIKQTDEYEETPKVKQTQFNSDRKTKEKLPRPGELGMSDRGQLAALNRKTKDQQMEIGGCEAHEAKPETDAINQMKAEQEKNQQRLELLDIELEDITFDEELIESYDPTNSIDAEDARETIKTQEELLGEVEDRMKKLNDWPDIKIEPKLASDSKRDNDSWQDWNYELHAALEWYELQHMIKVNFRPEIKRYERFQRLDQLTKQLISLNLKPDVRENVERDGQTAYDMYQRLKTTFEHSDAEKAELKKEHDEKLKAQRQRLELLFGCSLDEIAEIIPTNSNDDEKANDEATGSQRTTEPANDHRSSNRQSDEESVSVDQLNSEKDNIEYSAHNDRSKAQVREESSEGKSGADRVQPSDTCETDYIEHLPLKGEGVARSTSEQKAEDLNHHPDDDPGEETNQPPSNSNDPFENSNSHELNRTTDGHAPSACEDQRISTDRTAGELDSSPDDLQPEPDNVMCKPTATSLATCSRLDAGADDQKTVDRSTVLIRATWQVF